MREIDIMLMTARENQMPLPLLSVHVSKGIVPAQENEVGIVCAASTYYDESKGFLSHCENIRNTQILA